MTETASTLTPAETLNRAITRLRAAAAAPITHADACTVPPMAVCAQADLTAALDELKRPAALSGAVAAIETALRHGRGQANLTVGYGTEDGQEVFTVLLFDDGPECEDVMGPMPGDGSTGVLAWGQAPTLTEALMKCAAQKVGA